MYTENIYIGMQVSPNTYQRGSEDRKLNKISKVPAFMVLTF